MDEAEYRLYADAAQIAETAMGKERVHRTSREWVKRKDDDPLAWWCLTEWIVSTAKRFAKAENAGKEGS